MRAALNQADQQYANLQLIDLHQLPGRSGRLDAVY
jgi:hypothetical protein